MNMAHKGSLDDLGKNFKDGRQTKGMLPNLPPERYGADSVGEEDGRVSGVGAFMCHLFEKQLYTDVCFYFKEKKTFFSAHRVVLAAKCEYFEKLLFGKQTKDAVGRELHVQINDVTLSTFTSIVKYFYTDAIQLTGDSAVLETYRAAETYRIHGLVRRCKTYFDSVELTENNVCSTLQACNARDIDSPLRTRCIRYIKKNTRRVIRSRDFETCSFVTVREICQLGVLSLDSEVELLEAVLRWINLKQAQRQEKADMRRGLLKCVRFLSFSPKEFGEVLQKHPDLFTVDEGLQVLICLNDPRPDNVDSLPKWCNRVRKLRTCPAGKKSLLPDPVSEKSDRRCVQIWLRAVPGQPHRARPLTCLLHMRCLKGPQRVTGLTFTVAREGCALDVTISVGPGGSSFLERHAVESRESVLRFAKPVALFAGQTLQVEARAEPGRSCEFLQFDEWYAAHRDFRCYFIGRPSTDRLYFVSRIEYEPVAD